MRASFWVIGPLLARMGQARVSLPGGCAIGTRPVDLFIDGLKALGADIDIDNGYVNATARNGLVGNRYVFPKVSVGATHVLMMAAAMAKGQTVLENAAREPEVVNLAECLNAMGARISDAGSSTIVIDGVDRLSGAQHRVIPDRIETGTYAMAVAMTGGDVLLEGARADILESALDTISQTGAEITQVNSGIRVRRNGSGINPVDVTTEPYPGFPTDLQAQFMGLMTRARGRSKITETIFENRFMHVQGTGAPRGTHLAFGPDGHRGGRRNPPRRTGDGDRPARFGFAGDCGAGCRGRDHGSPGLPSRPRLRTAGRKTGALRRAAGAGRRIRPAGDGPR